MGRVRLIIAGVVAVVNWIVIVDVPVVAVAVVRGLDPQVIVAYVQVVVLVNVVDVVVIIIDDVVIIEIEKAVVVVVLEVSWVRHRYVE